MDSKDTAYIFQIKGEYKMKKHYPVLALAVALGAISLANAKDIVKLNPAPQSAKTFAVYDKDAGFAAQKLDSLDVKKGETYAFSNNPGTILNVVTSKKVSTLAGTIESYTGSTPYWLEANGKDPAKAVLGGNVVIQNPNGIVITKDFEFVSGKGNFFAACTQNQEDALNVFSEDKDVQAKAIENFTAFDHGIVFVNESDDSNSFVASGNMVLSAANTVTASALDVNGDHLYLLAKVVTVAKANVKNNGSLLVIGKDSAVVSNAALDNSVLLLYSDKNATIGNLTMKDSEVVVGGGKVASVGNVLSNGVSNLTVDAATSVSVGNVRVASGAIEKFQAGGYEIDEETGDTIFTTKSTVIGNINVAKDALINAYVYGDKVARIGNSNVSDHSFGEGDNAIIVNGSAYQDPVSAALNRSNEYVKNALASRNEAVAKALAKAEDAVADAIEAAKAALNNANANEAVQKALEKIWGDKDAEGNDKPNFIGTSYVPNYDWMQYAFWNNIEAPKFN